MPSFNLGCAKNSAPVKSLNMQANLRFVSPWDKNDGKWPIVRTIDQSHISRLYP